MNFRDSSAYFQIENDMDDRGMDASTEALCQKIAGADADAKLQALLALPEQLGHEQGSRDTENHRRCRDVACRAGAIESLVQIVGAWRPYEPRTSGSHVSIPSSDLPHRDDPAPVERTATLSRSGGAPLGLRILPRWHSQGCWKGN